MSHITRKSESYEEPEMSCGANLTSESVEIARQFLDALSQQLPKPKEKPNETPTSNPNHNLHIIR